MRTLRRKFSVLVLIVGTGVLLVEVAAVWGILTLQREIAWPMRSMETVLRGLHQTKLAARDLSLALEDILARQTSDAADSPVPDIDRARALATTLNRRLDALDESESYLIRSGLGSTRTLRTHVRAASEATDAARIEPAQLTESIRALAVVRDLIERIEGHVLGDSNFQIDHAERMRDLVLIVAIACFAALVLGVWLGAVLFGRWVLDPIGHLRVAAERIGAGDYSHRIATRGTDELATLSGDVNRMAQTIARMTDERVDRERLAAVGEMVQRVAHNLRNPLSGIRSLAEVTRQELPKDSDLRDVQSRIMATVDRFEEWLKQLIRTTRPIEIATVPLDLASWLPGVVEPLRPLSQIKRIEIRVSVPPTPLIVHADPAHLEHALVALVTNAIQAAPEDSPVEIDVEQAPERRAAIRVRDYGPGVPSDLRSRVFQPYFTTKPDGTGIGLALARHVIHQHRGTIAIHDPPADPGRALQGGPGAVFVVTIPTETD